MIQFLLNTFLLASQIGLIALGLSLTYSLLGFTNFAHISMAALGAYVSWFLVTEGGLHVVLAVAISCVTCGVMALAMDRLVFRHLRDASSATKMIASFGLAMALRAAVTTGTGASPQAFPDTGTPFEFAGVQILVLDLVVIGTAFVASLGFFVVLRFTPIGRSLRAATDNPRLAESRGISTENMIRFTWLVAGGFAALGGSLLALETQIGPNMGVQILIPVFAAAIIGGLGNPFGALVGALTLAAVQTAAITVDWGELFGGSSWKIESAWQDFIAMAAMGILLLARPYGLFGRAPADSR